MFLPSHLYIFKIRQGTIWMSSSFVVKVGLARNCPLRAKEELPPLGARCPDHQGNHQGNIGSGHSVSRFVIKKTVLHFKTSLHAQGAANLVQNGAPQNEHLRVFIKHLDMHKLWQIVGNPNPGLMLRFVSLFVGLCIPVVIAWIIIRAR